ncbi:hypothetical protein FNH05_00300, partial [Amycolatopsis rhizosphaerae]
MSDVFTEVFAPLSSMSGQQIYENFRNAEGPAKLEQAGTQLSLVMSQYQDRVDQIKHLASSMEEGWTGAAGDAAQRSAGPLAIAHADAASHMSIASAMIANQSQAFYDTKNKVQPVPAIPEAPSTLENFVTLGSAKANYEDKVAAANKAAQANVDVMNTWTDTSSTHASGLPASYGTLDPSALDVAMTSPSTATPSI